ncbi:unnamed protein product, partial [Timema podura]|nr:unnamed protein product [Timema podura]
MFAHVVNLVVMVLIPMVIIHIKNTEFSLIGASTVCTMYSLLFFKLWSYVQVNLWCRIKRNNSSNKTHLRRQSLSYHNFSEYLPLFYIWKKVQERPLALSSASLKPILWGEGREGESHGLEQLAKVFFRTNKN